jgi:DNA-binding NtrC family response regulator
LLESELLGHERGAFTGAADRKRGKFEQAHGGTLFLDEIGELKPELQAKLLRVLQERAFERVGGGETIRVDVRLVAATNRSLKQLVSEGRFREDLFYRLYVVPLRVPPLRDRPEDIVPLARHFLDELCRSTGKSLSWEPAALEALQRHRFPGNVRELRNLVHRLVVLASSDVITEAELPDEVTGRQPTSTEKDPFRRFLKRRPSSAPELRALRAEMQAAFDAYVREMERSFYDQLLERAGGNVSEAARLAGLNRTALHRKLGELKPDEG